MTSSTRGPIPERAADGDLLFVYGTLRSGAGGPMVRWLARHAQRLGSGSFRGRLYELGHYPGATASDNPRDRVRGEVYRLGDPQRTLARLDEHEGCGATVRDGEYERRRVVIALDSPETVTAWTYLYRKATRGLKRIPSGDFLHTRRR